MANAGADIQTTAWEQNLGGYNSVKKSAKSLGYNFHIILLISNEIFLVVCVAVEGALIEVVQEQLPSFRSYRKTWSWYGEFILVTKKN